MKKFISILLAVLMITAMFAVSMVSTFAAEPSNGVIDDDMNSGGTIVLNTNDGFNNANDDDMNGGGTTNDMPAGTPSDGLDTVSDGTPTGNTTNNAGMSNDVPDDMKNDTVVPETPAETVTTEDSTVVESATEAENATETVTTTASTKSTTATPTEKSSNINNPKTGDTILYAGIILAMAAACFVIVQLHARKKRSEM